MGRSEFEKQLRKFLDSKPFLPFVIEQQDATPIVVSDRRAISYLTGDSALFFEPDDSMHFVDCDNVTRITGASS